MILYIIFFLATTGADQAKALVMVLFSVVLMIVIPFFKTKDKKLKEKEPKLRHDGYYVLKYLANNCITYKILHFTTKGLVYMDTLNDYEDWKKLNPNEELLKLFQELSLNENPEYELGSTFYKVENISVSMRFYDPNLFSNSPKFLIKSEPNEYSIYYGKLLNDSLSLTFDYRCFSYSENDYVIENQFKNELFKFIPVN